MEFRNKAFSRDTHIAQAIIDGEVVAQLSWWTLKPDQRTARGAVQHVWTDPNYRRRGIATKLWRYTQGLDVVRPRHSRNRTPAGKAWIASL